jgi:hypothetical protein
MLALTFPHPALWAQLEKIGKDEAARRQILAVEGAAMRTTVQALLMLSADVTIRVTSVGYDLKPRVHTAMSTLVASDYVPDNVKDDIVRLLTNAGADLNVKDVYDGRTLLHYYAFWDNLPMVQFLLEHKADPGIRDSDGRLPRDLADDKNVKKLLVVRKK